MKYPTIEEVNQLLREGKSLNKLSEFLGVQKNTIKNHYQKLGYQFDRAVNQFVQNNNSVTQSNTPVKQKKDMNYIELEQRIKALEDKIFSKNKTSNFTLDSRVLRSDIKTRSIKISASAMQSFMNLAETKLNMYAKQDLLAMALLEFTDKYK